MKKPTKDYKDAFNAWLDPNGKFYECAMSCHSAWAMEYFEEKYGFIKGFEKVQELCGKKYSVYAYNALHKLGWVRLESFNSKKVYVLGSGLPANPVYDTYDPALTAKQKNVLKQWCLENNYKFENLFE